MNVKGCNDHMRYECIAVPVCECAQLILYLFVFRPPTPSICGSSRCKLRVNLGMEEEYFVTCRLHGSSAVFAVRQKYLEY